MILSSLPHISERRNVTSRSNDGGLNDESDLFRRQQEMRSESLGLGDGGVPGLGDWRFADGKGKVGMAYGNPK